MAKATSCYALKAYLNFLMTRKSSKIGGRYKAILSTDVFMAKLNERSIMKNNILVFPYKLWTSIHMPKILALDKIQQKGGCCTYPLLNWYDTTVRQFSAFINTRRHFLLSDTRLFYETEQTSLLHICQLFSNHGPTKISRCMDGTCNPIHTKCFCMKIEPSNTASTKTRQGGPRELPTLVLQACWNETNPLDSNFSSCERVSFYLCSVFTMSTLVMNVHQLAQTTAPN